MIIAIVSTLPPVNTSLAEYGKFLVEGLLEVSADAELHVLADVSKSNQKPEMQDQRLSVSRCWHFNDWKNPFKLMLKLMQIQPDVVVFNLQFASFGNAKVPAMFGLSAPMLARKMGFEVISIVHNLPDAMALDEPYFAKNKLDKWLIQIGSSVATRLLLKSSKVVVTLDKYREILEKKYKADNIEVIGLGSYLPPAKQVTATQNNRLLTFGKFGTYKRLDSLLKAFGTVSASHPDLELVIGGADHPSTPGYMAKIEAEYSHLNNVKFIGWIEDDNLAEVIRESKALILSYESTAGSSGPLHLAMSQGKAVLAPNFGDFQLVAKQEDVQVLFYKHRNHFDLVRKLEALASNRVDLQKMGEHNLRVAQVHSSENTARRYLKLIESVTDQQIAPKVSEEVLVPFRTTQHVT